MRPGFIPGSIPDSYPVSYLPEPFVGPGPSGGNCRHPKRTSCMACVLDNPHGALKNTSSQLQRPTGFIPQGKLVSYRPKPTWFHAPMKPHQFHTPIKGPVSHPAYSDTATCDMHPDMSLGQPFLSVTVMKRSATVMKRSVAVMKRSVRCVRILPVPVVSDVVQCRMLYSVGCCLALDVVEYVVSDVL